MNRFRNALWQASFLLACLTSAGSYGQDGYFGTAKVNINPLTPIMLSGYAGRATIAESTGVQQNIFVQAAAFGMGAETSLLLTVDSTGLPDNVVDPLRAKLANNLGIAQERIVMTCTHSHSCPCVSGYLPNLFGAPLPATQQQHVDAYTAKLVEWMEEAATEALDNRTPGHEISWANGSAGFGQNRRGEGVDDHDLPVMLVKNAVGEAKAIIASYATHGTTLNASDNLVSGDWPGYARQAIETLYPGAAAMIMIGAAADSNPTPAGTSLAAFNHGRTVANEVRRLIDNNLMTPVSSQISAFQTEVKLDFATTLQPGDPSGTMLAPSPSSMNYGVTSWTFGKDLAMVFMEGEVVADYSLRLKAELGDKVWVNAYSNDVMGYIPSERVLRAGGYEADSSNYYYGNPGRLAYGLEDKIVGAVHEQLFDFTGQGDRLQLLVDWRTGEASIVNMGDLTLSIDGYTIASPAGKLNPANGAWQSFQDQGLSSWDEANNSNSSRITEFKTAGSQLFAPGTRFSIGRPVIIVPPAKFGDDVGGTVELTFEYSLAGGGTEQGGVRAEIGVDVINNLVMTINPLTGAVGIRNASPFFDVSIAAYSIASTDGKLRRAVGWRSLADQSLAGWDEADNSNAFRVTEFNPTGQLYLAEGGTVLNLGTLLDVSGGAINLDRLKFEFLLSNGETLEGVIELAQVGAAGDYDLSGRVDGADFLAWQRSLGSPVAVAGAGADGNSNGIVDAGDLAVWRSHFGLVGNETAAASVPEPASSSTAWLLLSLVFLHRLRGVCARVADTQAC
ncbi:hypothetical protein [Lacipirellula sp.]|uniref:hypothetical protein n=1 Tax=Lacipirellula sp. TaxID=2691419 RepID=UPI003D0E7CB3